MVYAKGYNKVCEMQEAMQILAVRQEILLEIIAARQRKPTSVRTQHVLRLYTLAPAIVCSNLIYRSLPAASKQART